MTTGLTAGQTAEQTAGQTAGQTADLTVDTPLLRRAAEIVDRAAGAYRGDGTCEVFRSPLSDTSLGSWAAGREVVAAASRRVVEAVDAAQALALRVASSAEQLRAAAQHFELAEASAIPGPR